MPFPVCADSQLMHVLSNLFLAGTETSTSTLAWGILLLLHHTDVMDAVHREIDYVIGQERPPSLTDRQRMPYSEAVLMEIQRFGDVGPFSMLHRTHGVVRLRGVEIPAGTTIIPHLHAVHRDPTIWKEPYRFRPEHFLDEQGNLKPNKRLIPYGLGMHDVKTLMYHTVPSCNTAKQSSIRVHYFGVYSVPR